MMNSKKLNIIQKIVEALFGHSKSQSNNAHPLVYSSCFIISDSGSMSTYDNKNCSGSEFSILGISKLLAYGDYLRAQQINKNKSMLTSLEEELALYPYHRKITTQVLYPENFIFNTWVALYRSLKKIF